MTSRMRTVDAAIAQLKEDDPNTFLTKYALRKLLIDGLVPHVRIGVKYLVNYDGLLSFLADNHSTAESRPRISKIG